MAGGGGGTTKQVQTPWKGAQPYITDTFQRAQGLADQAPSYFGGPLTVGGLPSEEAAFRQQSDYTNSVFGGQQNLKYGDVTGATTDALQGNSATGQMYGAMSPYAAREIGSQFNGPTQLQGGNYGRLNTSQYTPTYGMGGGMDARGAMMTALNGQPDYAGVQGAIDAANAPIMRQFEQETLPGLNTRAQFLNNGTGGIKTLNRVMPEMGAQMAQNAQTLTNQERIRALTAQQDTAAQIANGGLQAYGMGLQGAGQSAALRLQGDTTNANLGSQYRGDALNLAQLSGQLAGQQGQQQLGALALAPSIYGMGMEGANSGMGYAQYQRALQEDQLSAEQQRFNYLRDQPMNQLQQYAGIVQPGAGMGGTTSTNAPGGSRAGSVIGGAMAGSTFGPIGTGLGALAGYFL